MATDPKAPHGRDENNVPLTPYGMNLDGTPRKSNRGRPRLKTSGLGARKAPAAKPGLTSTSNLSDLDRKNMLGELAMQLLVTPLATASQVPWLQKWMGVKQADALAADAFVIAQTCGPVFDAAILMSKTKPGILAWLDKAADNAPAVLLAGAVLQTVKAIADNHIRPSAGIANAGRVMARQHMEQMAAAVNEQAAAMRAQAEAQAAKFQAPQETWADTAEDLTAQFAAV